jgi:phospholipid/cholesterol/gamma-HCH transport system substrate-binding protein
MESKTHYIIVGLFVIILSLSLIAVGLWLSVGTENKIYAIYQAYMSESVSGLNLKAPVKYRGVEVGQVAKIALSLERPNHISVLLEIERGTPLKEDTFAILSTQGITGLAFIELTGGSLDAPTLTAKPGERYPEIQTKPSLLFRIDATITLLSDNLQQISSIAKDLLQNLRDVAVTANALMSNENRLAVANSLRNVETITNIVTDKMKQMDGGTKVTMQLIENTNKVLVKIPELLTSLQKTALKLPNIINSINEMTQNFGRTATTLTQAIEANSQQSTKMLESIAQTTKTIDNTVAAGSKDLSFFTQQALPEVTNSIRELRELLSELREFSQTLQNKPDALIFGKSKPKPGPGE